MILYIKKYLAGALFIAVISVLMPVHCAVPGGDAGAYLELPHSISATALGGACFAFDPEPSAIFLNPANLYNLKAISAQASLERYPLSVGRYSGSLLIPWRDFRFGAGILQHSIGEIQGRDISGNPISTFSYTYSAYSFGGVFGLSGGKFNDPCKSSLWEFSGGLAARILTQNEADSTIGTGFTVDLGISGKYTHLRYGIVVRNIYGQMTWNDAGETKSSLPVAVTGAIGYEYCTSNWAEVSIETKNIDRFKIKIGGQYLATDWAGFRGGIDFQVGNPTPSDEWRIAFGGVFYRKLLLPIELSYSTQYIAAVSSWSFGIALGWNTF